jgi:hypothetical protein
MDLREQGPALPLQALDHPDLPQRFAAVEVLGEDARRGAPEDVLAARGRQGAVPEVVAEVEVRIVHPRRATDGEQYEADLLPVSRDGVELAGHHLLEALKRGHGPFEASIQRAPILLAFRSRTRCEPSSAFGV